MNPPGIQICGFNMTRIRSLCASAASFSISSSLSRPPKRIEGVPRRVIPYGTMAMALIPYDGNSRKISSA